MLPVLGIGAFFVFGIWFVIRQKAAQRAAFEGFAIKYGLSYTGGAYPCAVGKTDGRYTVVQSRREPRQPVAYFQVQVGVHGAPPPGMVASTRFNDGGVKTGDAELDDKVRIDGPDAAAVIAWLTPSRRAALLAIAAGKHAFAVPAKPSESGPVVILDQQGFKSRLDWVEDKYTQVLAIARQLDA